MRSPAPNVARPNRLAWTLAVVALAATACTGSAVAPTAQGSPSRQAPPATSAPASGVSATADLPSFDACDVVPASVFARFAGLPDRVQSESTGASTVSSTCSYQLWGDRLGSVDVGTYQTSHAFIRRALKDGSTPMRGLGDEAAGRDIVTAGSDPQPWSDVVTRRGQRVVGAMCPMPMSECRALVAYALGQGHVTMPSVASAIPSSACPGVERAINSGLDLARAGWQQGATDALATEITREAAVLRSTTRATAGVRVLRGLGTALDALANQVSVTWQISSRKTTRSERKRVTGQIFGPFAEDTVGPVIKACGSAWLGD